MGSGVSTIGEGQKQAWEDVDGKPGLGQGGTLLRRQARVVTTATAALQQRCL